MGQFNSDLAMSTPALYGKDDDKKKKKKTTTPGSLAGAEAGADLGMERNVSPMGKLQLRRASKKIEKKEPKKQYINSYFKKIDKKGGYKSASVKKSKGTITTPVKPGKKEDKKEQLKPSTGTSPLGELGMSGNSTKRFPDSMLVVPKKYQKRVNTVLGR